MRAVDVEGGAEADVVAAVETVLDAGLKLAIHSETGARIVVAKVFEAVLHHREAELQAEEGLPVAADVDVVAHHQRGVPPHGVLVECKGGGAVECVLGLNSEEGVVDSVA